MFVLHKRLSDKDFFYPRKPRLGEPDSALLLISKEAEGEARKASTRLQGTGLPATAVASASSRKGTAVHYI